MTYARVPTGTLGGAHQVVPPAELEAFLTRSLAGFPVDGKTVVLVVPDTTRSCPMPELMHLLYRELIGRVGSLTALIALGTHSYLETEEIERWFGAPDGVETEFPGMRVVNHEWQDPSMIARVGRLSAERMAELSGGLVSEAVDVEINRLVVEADVALIVGPVFPHEVVGISGGNKYLIPGCATHEIIDLSHWVGALIGIDSLIGRRGITPVRAIINAGAELIPTRRLGICLVVKSGTDEVEFVATGELDDAWAPAADVAADSHIEYVDAPLRKVVSVMPRRYDDLWTAAKGCYKMQPAMAEGGEVIIYAPHITELSEVHKEIYDVGYHCVEYFTKQAERFAHVPKSVIAHSTHVRGSGTYDAATGVEHNRITVTLSTQVPREVCEPLGLKYLAPEDVDLDALARDPEVLVVPNAGEVLYRLATDRTRP